MTIERTCLEDGARAALNGQQRLVIREGEEDDESLGDVGIVSLVTVKRAQNRGVHVLCISFACNKVVCLLACLLALTHSLVFYMLSGTFNPKNILPPSYVLTYIR